MFLETNTALLYFIKKNSKMSKLLILTGKLKLLLGFNIVMFNYLNLVVERKVYVDYMTRLNPYSNYMRKQFLENVVLDFFL